MLNKLERHVCPCCGGYIGEAVGLDSIKTRIRSGHHRVVFDTLSAAKGDGVPKDALLTRMYGKGDLPETGDRVLHVVISVLRKELEAYGWTIHSRGGGRGNTAVYRLIPLEAGA